MLEIGLEGPKEILNISKIDLSFFCVYGRLSCCLLLKKVYVIFNFRVSLAFLVMNIMLVVRCE